MRESSSRYSLDCVHTRWLLLLISGKLSFVVAHCIHTGPYHIREYREKLKTKAIADKESLSEFMTLQWIEAPKRLGEHNVWMEMEVLIELIMLAKRLSVN